MLAVVSCVLKKSSTASATMVGDAAAVLLPEDDNNCSICEIFSDKMDSRRKCASSMRFRILFSTISVTRSPRAHSGSSLCADAKSAAMLPNAAHMCRTEDKFPIFPSSLVALSPSIKITFKSSKYLRKTTLAKSTKG